jgi:Nif-specific regulatory protein
MLAYLVIREGSKWTDVFRLIPGQAITVGRAPTNQIVIKDERCSRCHAEVFLSQGNWTLRDLESRNGTLIGSDVVRGDHMLQPGDIIRIGHSQLVFVHDLSKAFPDSTHLLRPGPIGDETVAKMILPAEFGADTDVLAEQEPATITHRRGQTKFLEPHEEIDDDDKEIPRLGRAAATLCRLAFALAKAPDVRALADVALSGLFGETQVDAGALLLLPRDFEGEATIENLEIIASRSASELPYHRVPNFLASTVLREGEAVLARNAMGDSTLGSRDSEGEMHATSVLCAPVRRGKRPVGLVHLYSTDPARVPDPDDLEFTLAVADTVAVALENLSRRQELAENLTRVRDENLQLRERLGVQSEIVGSSPLMARVTQEIARAAPSRATVLIRGESGVGKELVARAVHFSSPRRKGPFVCLNCAALSRSLLASELFGHEQGAFTGATQRKIGKFEASHQGTLMLDEIGEMTPAIQAKFLRVLEGHPFERVGGTESVKVDVRVIAATNRDLERDVVEGRFRRDLYFRLRVLEIVVPGLRKRPEDIPELAEYFLEKFNAETGRKLRGFSPAAVELLRKYRWPGNVRELKNVIERAVVLARNDFIECEDLTLTQIGTAGDTGDVAASSSGGFHPSSLADMERQHIMATLISTGWNKSQAAALLGIERSTLDRKIRRYEIAEETRRAPH